MGADRRLGVPSGHCLWTPKQSNAQHCTSAEKAAGQHTDEHRAPCPDTACLHSAAEARAHLVSHPAMHTVDCKMDKEQLLLLDDSLLGGFLG